MSYVEEMKNIDECDMEGFGTPDSSEKMTAILGGRWGPQREKQEGDKIISAQMLKVSL